MQKNSKLYSPAHIQEEKAAVQDDKMFAEMLGMFFFCLSIQNVAVYMRQIRSLLRVCMIVNIYMLATNHIV